MQKGSWETQEIVSRTVPQPVRVGDILRTREMVEIEYLTLQEFQQRLPKRLSLPTLRRYIKAGKLPYVQVGGKGCKILVPANALTLFLRNCVNTEPSPSIPQPAKIQSKPTRPARRPDWLRDART